MPSEQWNILGSGEQRTKWKREIVGSLMVQKEMHDLPVLDLELRDTSHFHSL